MRLLTDPVSGFDPVYVFCCNIRGSYLFISVTTCLLFTLLGPDHSECASGNALTDTAHTSPLGRNVVLCHHGTLKVRQDWALAVPQYSHNPQQLKRHLNREPRPNGPLLHA